MATITIEETVPTGTKVKFKGYHEEGDAGELSQYEIVEITGYDPDEKLYNVSSVDTGKVDSLFFEEFVLLEDTEAPAEEEEVEEEAPLADKLEAEEESDDIKVFKKTTSVTKALKEHDGNALDAAMAYTERKERTVFTLGGLLAYIKRNNTFLTILEDGEAIYSEGNVGFNSYVKDTLGIEPRTAAYYVDLYEMFSQVTTESKLGKIGWTKLRQMLPLRKVINTDNVDEWIDEAKTSTSNELGDKVRKALVDAGEETHGNLDTATQVKFTFIAHDDQAKVWEEAIDKAKSVIGSDTSESQALHHIVTEWLDLSV